jgi:hypothetical protein
MNRARKLTDKGDPRQYLAHLLHAPRFTGRLRADQMFTSGRCE